MVLGREKETGQKTGGRAEQAEHSQISHMQRTSPVDKEHTTQSGQAIQPHNLHRWENHYTVAQR